MIGELSELLRHSLANGKAGDAPLSDELEAARNYLEIEKIRFEEKLIVSFDVEPRAGAFRVPSMLIHPLVENAVKYGMQTSPMPLRVEVNARADNGALRLEVINTGKWIERSANVAGANVGIENARQRLRQAFPERHRFDVFERIAEIVQDRADLRRAQHRADRRRDGPQTDGAEKRHDPLRTIAHDQRE